MKKRSAPRNQVRGRAHTTTVQRRATRPVAQRAKARLAGGRSTSARQSSNRARSAATTRRAKTGSGRSGAAQLTTDHDEIRAWAEERGGHPATVKRSVKPNQRAGILRIDFPGFSGAVSLKPVSWEEWFDIFEESCLGFLHQDRTASGKPSRFNKIVCRK
jgi:hypothetical protein